MELYERFGLRIQDGRTDNLSEQTVTGNLPETQTLEQAAAAVQRTPEFQQWFTRVRCPLISDEVRPAGNLHHWRSEATMALAASCTRSSKASSVSSSSRVKYSQVPP